MIIKTRYSTWLFIGRFCIVLNHFHDDLTPRFLPKISISGMPKGTR